MQGNDCAMKNQSWNILGNIIYLQYLCQYKLMCDSVLQGHPKDMICRVSILLMLDVGMINMPPSRSLTGNDKSYGPVP